jgi:hypothetical protein
MLASINLRKAFDEASSTGEQYMLLRATGDCDCYSKVKLSKSEPNPFCKKCFGTGSKRMHILTPKLRADVSEAPGENENFLKQSITKFTFYLPYNFSFITNKDIIVSLNEQKQLETFYEIVEKITYSVDDFVYYEVFAKKISFNYKGGEQS